MKKEYYSVLLADIVIKSVASVRYFIVRSWQIMTVHAQVLNSRIREILENMQHIAQSIQ